MIMLKQTPELKKKIEASGAKIISLSLDDLKKSINGVTKSPKIKTINK
tara:strand:- start:240 stop:383 length:144 start_codon:yes stop_codon:yes gene_type:complete